MASSPITSWQIDGETVTDFILLFSKIAADGDCSHEIKIYLLLGRKIYDQPRQYIKKQRHDFAEKGPSHQGYRRRQWHTTPILLPGKSHGQRSLVGCSPWGCEELDMTELLHFNFSLSCIGEGNGNPLPCSCLENPRDSGARWAAVFGITQSRT